MAGRAESNVAPPLPNDDCVIIFRTERSSVRGRLVRLGPAANTILSSHQLPPTVAGALGEALALVSLFGSALKAGGKIILQTRTDGIVSFLVADLLAAQDGTGALRGYARFEKDKLVAIRDAGAGIDPGRVLGNGTMAVTLDEPYDAGRYQAVTAIEGVTLAAAASAYFQDRDATPAFVKLAVAPLYVKAGGVPQTQWRSGGLMLQPVRPAMSGSHGGGEDAHDDADGWNRVTHLASTVEDHELLDPTLTPERLLLRLFHEEGVRIERVEPLAARCRCSRERIADVLKSFGSGELAGMRDETGQITVTCEFCTAAYQFDLQDIGD